MQWWILVMIAKRSSANPSIIQYSQSGLSTVELLRHDTRREILELLARTRSRQAGVANVVVEIEIGVVHPDRMVGERNPVQHLAVARDEVQDRLDRSAQLDEIDTAVSGPQRSDIVDLCRRDVHVHVRPFHQKKRIVLRRKTLVFVTRHSFTPGIKSRLAAADEPTKSTGANNETPRRIGSYATARPDLEDGPSSSADRISTYPVDERRFNRDPASGGQNAIRKASNGSPAASVYPSKLADYDTGLLQSQNSRRGRKHAHEAL